jgi:general secretion pathway protein J
MGGCGRARDGEGGFTLFEILVGLAVSSLIMAGLGAAMHTINRGTAQGAASLTRQNALANGLEIVAGDVSRIERVPDDVARPTRLLFSGGPDVLTYILTERPGNNDAGLYWVRLAVRVSDDGMALVRMRAPYRAGKAAAGWGDEVTLFSGPVAMSFAYRAPGARLRSWGAQWQVADRLPQQIKLEVIDVATGRLRAPALVQTLKINAEAALWRIGGAIQ